MGSLRFSRGLHLGLSASKRGLWIATYGLGALTSKRRMSLRGATGIWTALEASAQITIDRNDCLPQQSSRGRQQRPMAVQADELTPTALLSFLAASHLRTRVQVALAVLARLTTVGTETWKRSPCDFLRSPALNFQICRPRRSTRPQAGQVLSARDSPWLQVHHRDAGGSATHRDARQHPGKRLYFLLGSTQSATIFPSHRLCFQLTTLFPAHTCVRGK